MTWFPWRRPLLRSVRVACRVCGTERAEGWVDNPLGTGKICAACHRRAVALYAALEQTWTPAPWGGRSAEAVADDLYAWCLDSDVSKEWRARLAARPAPDLRLVIGWLSTGFPTAWEDWIADQPVALGIWPEDEQGAWIRHAGALLDLVDRARRGEL